jgi:3-oxoadipate enol-lactonase
MPTARCNGVELYYEVHGEGEPLLCVMGLAADSLSWALQVPAWSQRHRTVIFDNRDIGRSGYVDADYSVPDMAADALALADELGLDSFHLLGVSMGGTIAQEMALAAPERVRTLTLCVTFAGAGRWAREKARLWARDAAGRTREETIDELLLLCLSEEFFENADAVAFAKQMMLSNPHPQQPEGFARQLRASCRHEARDRLGALSMPVHIVGAEHDVLVPVWKSRELAEEFNRAVLDFIAEHAPAAA